MKRIELRRFSVSWDSLNPNGNEEHFSARQGNVHSSTAVSSRTRSHTPPTQHQQQTDNRSQVNHFFLSFFLSLFDEEFYSRNVLLMENDVYLHHI